MSGAQPALIAGPSVAVDDFPVALSWVPDSSALIVGGGEGGIHQVTVDGTTRKLGEHAPGVLQLACQPKGTLFASTGQDGSVSLWSSVGEVGAPRVVHRSRGWPAGLTWRADGEALAFAVGKDAFIVDAAGQLLRELRGHTTPISHLAWRGRSEIVAAGNGALFVDRVDTGAIEQLVVEGTPLTLALSADLKIAANGLADGTVNFRYINNRKRSRMSGYEGKVDQTCWSANSRYLATASSGASSIVVWDFAGKGPEGSEPLQLNAHEERVEALAWQREGSLLASAGRDWRVVLWRPAPNSRKALDIQLLDGPACGACWAPDGKRLAVAQAGKIRFFSLTGV